MARAPALPRGLFGPDGTDVAYEPWRALVPLRLHVGPSTRAPLVVADGGEAVALEAGGRLGRQTVRNPRCLDRPPLRPAIDGFVWGYAMPPAVRKSGWARLADLEPDPAYEELACGPAAEDFDRRHPHACGGHCDGRGLASVREASGTAQVTARDLYLRYAPGSTAFRYLVGGDEVRLVAQWRAGRWLGVEVRSAEWAPRRARGWVLSGGVTRR
jgi:hypothetical protein